MKEEHFVYFLEWDRTLCSVIDDSYVWERIRSIRIIVVGCHVYVLVCVRKELQNSTQVLGGFLCLNKP